MRLQSAVRRESPPAPGSPLRWGTLLLVLAGALAAATPSPASNGMRLGLFDDAVALDAPHDGFPILKALHVQVVRMTLAWGGPGGVANKRPAQATNPLDPAYDWHRYDEAVQSASDAGIEVLLTIVGTPAWANGGKPPQYPPSSGSSLKAFAYAAAERYSGTLLDTTTGRVLPRVSMWLAWNEPNNPVFLLPQYTRAGAKWKPTAAAAYAQICNAIYSGVHATGGPEQVACGATAPRGGNNPSSSRPSISPLAFVRAAKRYGLRRFDAWAHHPYYGSPGESPRSRPHGGGAVELGNIGTLIKTVTRLYGRKPIWITEYGYQTKPPDSFFGVSWAKQATYLRSAYEIARRNPRIDLFTWFLLKDSPSPESWQSGLLTAKGKRKPAFDVFAALHAPV